MISRLEMLENINSNNKNLLRNCCDSNSLVCIFTTTTMGKTMGMGKTMMVPPTLEAIPH